VLQRQYDALLFLRIGEEYFAPIVLFLQIAARSTDTDVAMPCRQAIDERGNLSAREQLETIPLRMEITSIAMQPKNFASPTTR